jgi:aldehyde dehydrogenase (NAD+)
VTSTAESSLSSEVDRVKRAFGDGRTRHLEWRVRQLDRLVEMLEREEGRLLDAMRQDLGKPAFEGWATDIGSVATELRYLRKRLPGWLVPTRVRVPLVARPGRAEVRLEPLGSVLVISPWNYPIQLSVTPIGAALAAGNTVVLKPSELSPATSAALAELLARYLDPAAIAVLEGGPEVAEELLTHRFDHIFFTGSGRVGRLVAEAAAKHLTPTTLELGGKSPALVSRTADLEVASRRLVQGKFVNAGQTCLAPDYVLVAAGRRDQLVEELRRAIRDSYGPDPRASPHYGRVVNLDHLRRLAALLDDQDSGVVVEGGGIDAADRYMAPTLVVDPDPGSALMEEEIFGPILPILTMDGVDEAIEFVNARPKPLVLYLFADDEATIDRVVRRTSSGGVGVNQCLYHFAVSDLPFGGVGASGYGSYHGLAGIERLSNVKGVLIRPEKPDLRLAYPPYGPVSRRLLRRII